jgi:hypothetical protein
LSPSYGVVVAEQLTKYFAGNPSKPGDEEFRLMIGTWTESLQDVVPEYRLPDVFVWLRQNRTSTFQLSVEEVCQAWQKMKVAERVLKPVEKPAFATDVCRDCNGTGTKLRTRRDHDLGMDYVYGEHCYH